jgi:hypothetical protein
MEILAMEIRVGAVNLRFYRLDYRQWWQRRTGPRTKRFVRRIDSLCRDRSGEAGQRWTPPRMAMPTGVGRQVD